MATCLDTITYAMRQCRVLRLGAVPKAAEAAEGMAALQGLYDRWRTGGMFGELEDVYLEENDTAEEGKRYFVPTGFTLTAPTSVYVDTDSQTRQPRDLALYEALTQAGAQTARLYDRTEWVDLIGLVQGDIAPLSGRDAYGLAACLATDQAFAVIFGSDPSPGIFKLAANFKRGLMYKIGSTQARTEMAYY